MKWSQTSVTFDTLQVLILVSASILRVKQVSIEKPHFAELDGDIFNWTNNWALMAVLTRFSNYNMEVYTITSHTKTVLYVNTLLHTERRRRRLERKD